MTCWIRALWESFLIIIKIFLGFGETCNEADSTQLSQTFEKSTYQQPTHYAQHAEDCKNERSAIVLWLRPLDIKSMG
jgi:hypothetical protein